MKDSVDFPRFPSTPHIERVQSVTADDAVVTSHEFDAALLGARSQVVEEKLDGANVRIRFDGESEPVIGNRDHVLKKGYLKDTPSKLQFRPLWTWVYDHRDAFKKLKRGLGIAPVVFGEWLYAKHTVFYDSLPTLLVPFDLYLDGHFMDPLDARDHLQRAGFILPMAGLRIRDPDPKPWSMWSSEPREGVVIKLGDGKRLTGRFKLVRADFKPRDDFTTSPLERNLLRVWGARER